MSVPSDSRLSGGSSISAFENLFRQEYDRQVRRAFLMTGSDAAAHDVVAEAMTALYRRMDRVDQPVLYLNRSVMNGCRDWGRRRVRWSKLVNSFAAEEPVTVDRHHDQLELAEALAVLPYRQRAAIVLRFYGRETEAGIAETLGCRPGTVGSLIHRGLSTLRKELS